MYYDRSFSEPATLLSALLPGGTLNAITTWIKSDLGRSVNARLELRKNRGDRRRGATQVYIGRNAVLTIVSRDIDSVSFACHPQLATPDFLALPDRCLVDAVPVYRVLAHLTHCAARPSKDDEGAIHAGFMTEYGALYTERSPVLAVDSEVQIGFVSAGGRRGSEIRDEFEDKVATRYDIKGAVPRKLDVLGVGSDGELLIIELKGRGGDLNQAVLQAAVHVERFGQFLAQGSESTDHINTLISQKIKLGVLPQGARRVLKPRVIPVVAMPDDPEGWFDRWVHATQRSRARADDQLDGLELWLLDSSGALVERRRVDAPPRQSWIDFVQAQQIAWKQNHIEPEAARTPGHHVWYERGQRQESRRTYDRFVPIEYATHNLLPDIRSLALERFADFNIRWWGSLKNSDGAEVPTNHLRSSQMHCVNTLLSLHHTGTLLEAVRDLVPGTRRLVNIEADHPVAFEWIGLKNYLGEHGGRRGEYRTSIDAFLVAELADDTRVGIFLEWKLTETYDPEVCLRYSRRGTDRSKTYQPAYARAGDVFAEGPAIEAFHYEPHDQLLRQALLANEVRLAGEFEVQRMLLVDCVPTQNDALRTAVPEGLSHLGDTIDAVWSRLLPRGLLEFKVFDPLRWMALSSALNVRYGALHKTLPPRLSAKDPGD